MSQPASELPSLNLDLNELIRAARLNPPEIRQRRPRFGRPGVCVACREALMAHVDAAGGWIGCPAASPDSTFVLVPIDGQLHRLPRRRAPEAEPRVRRFRAARYTPVVMNIDLDTLSDHRKRTMKAIIDAGPDGAVVGVIRQQSGLSTGSVTQALSWLEAHQLISARADESK